MPECLMDQACCVEEAGATSVPEPVYLEPFLHQVSGHSGMLRFDDTTVCKPLVPREQYFYETMPEEMKEFTPQYRGITSVKFAEDPDGYFTLVAYPQTYSQNLTTGHQPHGSSPVSDGHSDSDSESSPANSARQRFRIRRSGSIEMEAARNKEDDNVHNPWYLRCYKVQLEKMKKRGNQKFILLENLASSYKCPCILDLKMGTRQHGDDASEEKRILHTQKCEDSTSSSLGTRLGGMQSYQVSSGEYVCLDKYFGRTMTVEGMKDALYQFLHNGVSLRLDLLNPILEKLRRLHKVLSSHHSFRFYSSSLLIMYDGSEFYDNNKTNGYTRDKRNSLVCEEEEEDSNDVWCGPPPPRVDIRMIDFAHVTHKGFRGDHIVHQGPDHGYLFGLENLIHMFEDIKKGESSSSTEERST